MKIEDFFEKPINLILMIIRGFSRERPQGAYA